ncbi:MAG: crossover junction endodeoxyribonuclease RuvC [Candidatus Portnoybacteria bacterium RIFCSPLOWO2_01_FULL_43_11]|uniref:Crossover junction endodeoxyribonuclease RuvC n=3 Tax=Candidatus Portnoyibacteriota TaxID=1817913 RepID=A0A1G2FD46_9BACT|nr:MAG: crossover junction endodeoxyribonuclease RuvC [Candidatus Portnoybacteria bacterium RIFCSPHIGHO2_01_FULL_40_12b]OGZ38159.1 MAG: crossover junction endodeoxyribonuclease RuvC [Candidatus Portnoybacteria bacterium RIFCSPLOWO2_01_FULL_43_11]OGZ40327.1 MAG: crossover junction endodeoxyribonuclease RuvC [Candidatus Portnoybacteria bacterium RIFCSPLOWO2_02_FULL_40_15]
MTILGLDPGTAATGYGVIKKQSELRAIDYGCIRTSPQFSTAERLKETHQQIAKLIKKHKPDIIAIEDIFFFKNLKTAIKVSQARGVALLSASQAKIPIAEFTPLQIKQAVTSYGRADKAQVQKMVKILLGLKEIPKPDDAADALAVAICCANTYK